MAAKSAADLGGKIESEIAFDDYCQLVSFTGEKQGKGLCEKPAQTVCQYNGKVLDSTCSYTPDAGEVLMSETDHRNIFCQEEKKTEKDLLTQKNLAHCKKLNLSKDKCVSFLRFNSEDENKNPFNKKIFNSKKVDKIFELGEMVRDHFFTLISGSNRLSDKRKQVLIDKIKKTKVYLNEDRFKNPELSDCYGSSDGKLSNGVFNQMNDYGQNEIHICSGLAMNMEYMNPHAFIHILAHEFAHSIDPCGLEQSEDAKKNEYKKYYPQLVSCMRGTKNGKCEGSDLNCNGKDAAELYCKENYPNQWKLCRKSLNSRPSCVVGKHTGNHDNIQQEQINEAFSDYMASEVMGAVMDKASEQERSDALLSISSQVSRRHDGCLKGKSNDSHPNAYMRLNKVMMSSEKGRKGFNCKSEEKKTCIGL